MGKLAEILKDLEQRKISVGNAEKKVMSLFSGNEPLPPDIRDEMDADMEEGGMPQGEIEGCLTHWGNKYVIHRKDMFINNR